MKILVINCGSSSIKFKLFEMPEEILLAEGIVEKIREEISFFTLKTKNKTEKQEIKIPSHSEGLELIAKSLTDRKNNIISSIDEIKGVGHRVVHGGEGFDRSVVIDDFVIKRIEEYQDLAPLHNPHNLAGIKAAIKFFPGSIQVAAFDTAFHTTIPEVAYIYGIPYEFYEDYGIRRFGFHGTSFRYIMERLKETGRSKGRVIICHLGNGASVVAVLNGKSMDTSMGFTPMEGLVMGTRCGDIDPGILIYLIREKGYSWKRIDDILDRESGLKGLSGKTYEMKEIEELAAGGDERAKLALDVYTYRVAKYIAAYTVPLGGLDVLVFTGGIGENSFVVRESVCGYLEHVGVFIDRDKNKKVSEGIISGGDSEVDVMVIPTNEELMIARDCFRILSGP